MTHKLGNARFKTISSTTPVIIPIDDPIERFHWEIIWLYCLSAIEEIFQIQSKQLTNEGMCNVLTQTLSECTHTHTQTHTIHSSVYMTTATHFSLCPMPAQNAIQRSTQYNAETRNFALSACDWNQIMERPRFFSSSLFFSTHFIHIIYYVSYKECWTFAAAWPSVLVHPRI